MLHIDYNLLSSWGACKEGYDWFNDNFPDGITIDETNIIDFKNSKIKFNPDFVEWTLKKINQDNIIFVCKDFKMEKRNTYMYCSLKNKQLISSYLTTIYDEVDISNFYAAPLDFFGEQQQ